MQKHLASHLVIATGWAVRLRRRRPAPARREQTFKRAQCLLLFALMNECRHAPVVQRAATGLAGPGSIPSRENSIPRETQMASAPFRLLACVLLTLPVPLPALALPVTLPVTFLRCLPSYVICHVACPYVTCHVACPYATCHVTCPSYVTCYLLTLPPFLRYLSRDARAALSAANCALQSRCRRIGRGKGCFDAEVSAC